MCIAAQFGHVNVVEMLAAFGASVNLPKNDGLTPLMASVMHNQVACAKSLLELNSDTTRTTKAGWSVAKSENAEIKALLKAHKAKTVQKKLVFCLNWFFDRLIVPFRFVVEC